MKNAQLPDEILQDLSAFLDGECSLSKQCSVMKLLSESEEARKAFDEMVSLRDSCQSVLRGSKVSEARLWDQIACELRDVNLEQSGPSLKVGEVLRDALASLSLKPSVVGALAGIFIFLVMGFVVSFDHVTVVSLLDTFKLK